MMARLPMKKRALDALEEKLARKMGRVTNTEAEEYILGDANYLLHPIIQNDAGEGFQDTRYWLVRRTEDAPAEPVPWSMGSPFPAQPGILVWVGYDFNGVKSILKPSNSAILAQGLNPNVYNVLDMRAHGFTDTESFPRLVARAIGTATNPSTIILVSEDLSFDDTHTVLNWTGGQIDLASSIPSAGLHRLAHLWLTTALTLVATISTTKSVLIPITPADYQECLNTKPPRARPVAVYRLRDGQTAVTEADKWYDGRQFLNQEQPRMNWSAVAAPTFEDDESSGYDVGSMWMWQGARYICSVGTEGAAAWYADAFPLDVSGDYTVPAGHVQQASSNTIISGELVIAGELIVG